MPEEHRLTPEELDEISLSESDRFVADYLIRTHKACDNLGILDTPLKNIFEMDKDQ